MLMCFCILHDAFYFRLLIQLTWKWKIFCLSSFCSKIILNCPDISVASTVPLTVFPVLEILVFLLPSLIVAFITWWLGASSLARPGRKSFCFLVGCYVKCQILQAGAGLSSFKLSSSSAFWKMSLYEVKAIRRPSRWSLRGSSHCRWRTCFLD